MLAGEKQEWTVAYSLSIFILQRYDEYFKQLWKIEKKQEFQTSRLL